MKINLRYFVVILLACFIIGFVIIARNENRVTDNTNNNATSKKVSFGWQKILAPEGLTNPISFCTDSENNIFTATRSNGVWHSIDGGSSWSATMNGIKECYVWDIITDSKNNIYIATGRGIYRSVDHANSWHLINSGLTNLGISALTSDSKGNIYARTSDSAIFQFNAEELNWKQVCPSLPQISKSDNSFVVSSNGSVFALGTSDIYRCAIGGSDKKWVKLDTGTINGSFNSLAIDDKHRILAGIESSRIEKDGYGILFTRPTDEPPVLVSQDGGEQWSKLTTDPDKIICQCMDVVPGGIIALGTIDGILLSRDYGISWDTVLWDTMLPDKSIKEITICKNGRIIASASGRDIYIGSPKSQ